MFTDKELLFMRDNRHNKIYIRFGVYTSQNDIIMGTIQTTTTFCNKEHLDTTFIKRMLSMDLIELSEYMTDSEREYVFNQKALNDMLDQRHLNVFKTTYQESKFIDYIKVYLKNNENSYMTINTLSTLEMPKLISGKLIQELDRTILKSLISKGIVYKVNSFEYVDRLELHRDFLN